MKAKNSEDFSPRDVAFEIYDENADLVMSGRYVEDNDLGERSEISSGTAYNIKIGVTWEIMKDDLAGGPLPLYLFVSPMVSPLPLDADNISFCVRSDIVIKSVKSNWGFTAESFADEMPQQGTILSSKTRIFSEEIQMKSGLLAIDGMAYTPPPFIATKENQDEIEGAIIDRFSDILDGDGIIPTWMVSETAGLLASPEYWREKDIKLAVSMELRKIMLDIGSMPVARKTQEEIERVSNRPLSVQALDVVAANIKDVFCGMDVSEWVWYESMDRCSVDGGVIPNDALASTLSGLIKRADLKYKDDLNHSKLKALENDERADMPLSSDLNSESSQYYAQKLIDLDIKNEMHRLLSGYLSGEIKPYPYDRLKFNTLNEAAITMGKAFGFEVDEEIFKEELVKTSDIKLYLNQESKRTDPALRIGDKDKGIFRFPKTLSTIGESVFLKMTDRNALFASREALLELVQAATKELKGHMESSEPKLFDQVDVDDLISASIKRS